MKEREESHYVSLQEVEIQKSKKVKEFCRGVGIDVSFDCSEQARKFDSVFSLKKGSYIQVGVLQRPVEVDMNDLALCEINIFYFSSDRIF